MCNKVLRVLQECDSDYVSLCYSTGLAWVFGWKVTRMTDHNEELMVFGEGAEMHMVGYTSFIGDGWES